MLSKLWLCIAIVALASPVSAQQIPPVTISGGLAQALVLHLQNGGTISAGQNLAQQIIDASQEPARVAAEEKTLRDKIATEAKTPGPTPEHKP